MDRNSFKSRSVGAHLTAGVKNTVYTCPNNYTAHIVLLFAANLGSGNKHSPFSGITLTATQSITSLVAMLFLLITS